MTTGQVHQVAHARTLENSAAGAPPSDELLRSELSIVAELIRRYGSRVATFSPSPYDEYVNSYFERLGVRANTDGSQYRVIAISDETLNLAEHSSETPVQDGPVSTVSAVVEVHKSDLTRSEEAVLKRLSKGNIVWAILDQTGSTATLKSISFK